MDAKHAIAMRYRYDLVSDAKLKQKIGIYPISGGVSA